MRELFRRVIMMSVITSILFNGYLYGQSDSLPPSEPDSGAVAELDDLDALLELADKDLNQLSQVQVTRPSIAPSLDTVVSTVERKESTVGRTPAAVFVITNDMIRRSGARSIPEVLRMAPGVQVAHIDGNKWSVSIRGFGNRFANKLLVQIDGRGVYTPLFGGVFWDAQDVLLEDVERIEVVRGPGGTVWGDNAVNGVINIVTKKVKDTQGTFVEAGAGTEERSFGSVRQGGQISENAHMRVYGKWFDRDAQASTTLHDDYRQARTGARVDWSAGADDNFTLQGDYYDGSSGTQSVFGTAAAPYAGLNVFDEALSGGNVLYRWTHDINNDSDWRLQAYYDNTQRKFENVGAFYRRDTLDLDFQHRFVAGENHEIIWGLGYRTTWDEFQAQPYFLSLNPGKENFDSVSMFIQDTITLIDNQLFCTIGSKVSYNDFTGGEVQPSARLLWTPTDRVSTWGAVSRAVRTATRVNRDGRLVLPGVQTNPFPPIYPTVSGQSSIESEDVLSLEFGFRHQPVDEFSWDLALYYNEYTDLIGITTPAGFVPGPEGLTAPAFFDNNGNARTYGAELGTTVMPMDDWSIRTAYTFLNMDMSGPNTSSPGDNPRNQFYLQSSHQITKEVEFDVIWRYVDNLPDQHVPSYSTMDLRAAWKPTDWLELYVVGRNLLDNSQPEFGNDIFAGTQATEVQRSVYGGLSFRY